MGRTVHCNAECTSIWTLIICWFLSYHSYLSWVEAKKRNPNIKLYGLAWAFPSWVGNSSGDPFKFPELTARYLVEWVAGAKSEYGTHGSNWRVRGSRNVGSWAMRSPLRGLRLDVDYLGIWNEKASDSNFVSLPDSPLAAMSVIV